MGPQQTPAKQRLQALDAWRGICAMLVALLHLDLLSHLYPIALIRHASLCVDFFFVLSGFIMRHVYHDEIANFSDGIAYIIRRFGRLYPLHIITLAAYILLTYAKYLAVLVLHYWPTGSAVVNAPSGKVALSLLAQLLLLQGMSLFSVFGNMQWNYPSWSISVEFWAYFVFAAVCMG